MASTPHSTNGPARAGCSPAPPSDGHHPRKPVGARTSPAHARPGRPFSTVWVCPADLPVRTGDVLDAVLPSLVTTYTQSGDRVLLATADRPGSRKAQDRLIDTVRRIGREAATRLFTSSRDDHVALRATDPLPAASGSGPGPDDVDSADPITAETIAQFDRGGPATDRFELIIAIPPEWLDDPAWITDWADLLTDSGALIMLTDSDRRENMSAALPVAVNRSAALAGLTLVDRLILLHQDPSPAPPFTDRDRRRVALGTHRRIHTEAHVFRMSRRGGAA